jgi:hypothetical protein
MAGGMHRRGAERLSLHERIHGVAPSAEPTELSPAKPCWVLASEGRQPGLLLDWRRTPAGWQGRVVYPIRQGSAWVVVEEWVRAEWLTRGG